MTDWDREDLALLARAASDLTALAATIELLRRHHPSDRGATRARILVDRLLVTVTDLLEHLRR